MQRLGLGDRLTLMSQVLLGLVAQHRNEQVIHAGEVVMHQRRLDARLVRHPTRGRRRIPLIEHDLGSRLDQRFPGRLAADPWLLVSRGAGHEGTLSVERPPNNCFWAHWRSGHRRRLRTE